MADSIPTSKGGIVKTDLGDVGDFVVDWVTFGPARRLNAWAWNLSEHMAEHQIRYVAGIPEYNGQPLTRLASVGHHRLGKGMPSWTSNANSAAPLSLWWKTNFKGAVYYNACTGFTLLARFFLNYGVGDLYNVDEQYPQYKWDCNVYNQVGSVMRKNDLEETDLTSALSNRVWLAAEDCFQPLTMTDLDLIPVIHPILSNLVGAPTLAKLPILPSLLQWMIYLTYYIGGEVRPQDIELPPDIQLPMYGSPAAKPALDQQFITYTWKENEYIPQTPNEGFVDPFAFMGADSPLARERAARNASTPAYLPSSSEGLSIPGIVAATAVGALVVGGVVLIYSKPRRS